MIRKLTYAEKAVNPDYGYMIEVNNFRHFITERDFDIIYYEIMELMQRRKKEHGKD